MGKDFNDKFRDCIDKINNIAKSKGWKNGKDWAAFAVKFHLISESMKVDYDNCHELRNSMSHGNAENIVVHQATYSTAKTFLKIIEAKIRENKGNKKIRKFDNTINERKYDKRSNNRISKPPVFSDTEEEYLNSLLYQMDGLLDSLFAHDGYEDSGDDILNTQSLVYTLMFSEEPLHQNKKLLYALRNRLYALSREHNYTSAEKYCYLLDPFLQ